jgi:hypothetical protein
MSTMRHIPMHRDPYLMPVFVEGGQFGGRDLIVVAIGYDLAPMLALGWRFPRVTGREVEGGGVIRDDRADR